MTVGVCVCLCVYVCVVVVVGMDQPVPTANGPGLQKGSRDPFSPLSGGLGSPFYTLEIVGEKI